MIGSIIGSIAGGLISSSGASKAADAQSDAAKEAAKVQWDMYTQSRDDMGPYRDVGTNALYQMADLYGLGYGGSGGTAAGAPVVPESTGVNQGGQSFEQAYANALSDYDREESRKAWLSNSGMEPNFAEDWTPKPFVFRPQPEVINNQGIPASPAIPAIPDQERQQNAMSKFFTSPDYNFRRDEGIRSIENSMLSRGKGLSGDTGRALTEYAGNLASSEYGNYYNRLANLAGIGQTSTSQGAALGQNAAAGIGNANLAAGQARGSGYIGQADAWGNALSGAFGAAGYGGSNWGGNNSPSWLSTASGSQYNTNPFSQQSMMLANQWS